jgi:formate dehydrogenase subunit gamma
MFLTGIGLWPAGLAYVEELLGFKATIDQRRMAAVIHSGAAIITIAIWIIHVYAAIWVRGTISAMTRGSVTGGWAWRHHRRWLRTEIRKEPGGPQPAE